MKYEACEKCPLKDTCNLIKQEIETQCSLNAKYAKPFIVKENKGSDLSCPKELFVATKDDD